MAYFDKDNFRKEAEAAGYGKDAIEAHIAKIDAQDAAEKHETRTRVLAPAAAASAAVAQPVVTPPAPTPAPVAAAPALPKINKDTSAIDLFNMRPQGTLVERIGANINEAAAAAGPAVTNVASNATQDSLNYARDAIANNPELTGALAAIPVLYGANKLGLFDNLGSKMSSSAAQPQPFVGGSGPRNTPQPDQMAGSYWDWFNRQPANQVSGAPSAPQPQAWDIHGDPSFGNFLGDGTAPATPAAPAAPVNTKLQELQARAAAGTPTPAASSVPAEAAAPPVTSARQAAIAEANARLAAVKNSPEVQNSVWGVINLDETPEQALIRRTTGKEKLDAAIEAHSREMNAALKLPEGPAIQPIAPSAAPNSSATKAVTETIQVLSQAETPVAAMPSRPVTPTPAAALPTGELKTGSGLTAYAGEGKPRERFPKEFKSTADIPKGYAFVPGMGPGTNVIRNDFGQAGYNALVQEQGGPFGEDKATRDFIKQYNEQRVGPPATRELRKSLGLPLPENTKGIPMKIAKVGGVVGAIMAIPELANAAQNRNVGQAAAVASGFLPPAIQALIYSGGLDAGAEEEARFLRMRDYALKAGRGVAQGYDTRRLIGAAPPGQRELIPGMK
jgi:hypothetical protein